MEERLQLGSKIRDLKQTLEFKSKIRGNS